MWGSASAATARAPRAGPPRSRCRTPTSAAAACCCRSCRPARLARSQAAAPGLPPAVQMPVHSSQRGIRHYITTMMCNVTLSEGTVRSVGPVLRMSETPLKRCWADCRAESSETSPRSAAEAGSGGAPSAGRLSGADPAGGGSSSVTVSQASSPADAAAAGAHMRAQRGQTGKSCRTVYMHACILDNGTPRLCALSDYSACQAALC